MANTKDRGVKDLGEGVFFIDYQVGKKRCQKRIRASSLKEAKWKRQELIVALRKQEPMSESETERLNSGFEDAWLKLEADLRSDDVCHKNLLRNKIVFQRMFRDFRQKSYPNIQSPSQLTATFFYDYKAYFINKLGHNPKGGFRAELICIKAMMRRFCRMGYCNKDIIESLSEMTRPKSEKKAYPIIPNSKIKQMLNFIKDDRPDYFDPIYFMTRTGRRVNEVCSVERRDVEFNGLRPTRLNVRAEITKMKEDAPLERIDDELAWLIQSGYKRGSKRKTVYLFCNQNGKKISQTSIRNYLKKASQEFCGETITPHYFRHRFLTECGKAGVPMVDVMSISGIRDLDVIRQYYQHQTAEGMDKVLEVTRIR